MSEIGYRPEIDGLRAVAVIPVVLFHMGLSWMPGGFIGVDVFFVISGFLITSIIKKELEEGVFSFRDFWARRILRILPAMVFVTACTLAVTYFFVFRPEQQAIGKQALAALLSVGNIYFWRNTGNYWGSQAEESPLLHAWSLSVEEQFYLFFPVAMWLIFRFRPRWLQGWIATVAAGSLALFLWGLQVQPVATFYLLPTRVWELGAGCLLAVSLSNQPSKNSICDVFAMVGLGMIMLSCLFLYTLGAGLCLAVVGASFVIAFGQTGLCNKLLSGRPVVHIGKLSYSLYLWHWPVLVLAEPTRISWDGPSDKVLLLCATYLLSIGTYHLVEKPTRRRTGMVPPTVTAGIIVAAVALWMWLTPRVYTLADGFVTPVDKFVEYDIHPTKSVFKSQFREGGIISLREAQKPELVLLGDSHAVCCADVISKIAEKNRISTAFYAMSGLDPFCKVPPRAEQRRIFKLPPDLQLEVDETLLKYLAEWQPKAVLISCRWEQVDELQATQFLEWLSDRKIHVLLLGEPPYIDIPEGRTAMKEALYAGMKYTGGRQYWPISNFATNEVAHKLAGQFENVEMIPVYDIYANGKTALLFDNHEVVYRDDDHLTINGVRLAMALIEKAILKATARTEHETSK